VSGQWSEAAGSAGVLRYYAAGGSRLTAPLLLVCPELPTLEGAREDIGLPYEAVAERVAQESGWRVLAGMFRGVGGSAGSFSGAGWLEDAAALVETELSGRPGLRVAGFGFGGAVALALAVADERVRGVACFAVPLRLGGWVTDPKALVERCRSAGVVQPGFPADVGAWAAELEGLEPLASVARLGKRSLLFVQGSEDDGVPPESATELAEAAGRAELQMVLGAGHWLRADPRATATLIGWLERQS
jgi:alpha/beta superfamily hydrolase